MNIFNVFPSIFGKKAREVNDQAKKDNIGGNLAGDGMQNGGTLVIDKGGKVLLCFKQENAADHVENSEILKALGLNAGVTGGQSEGATGGAEGDGARKNVCKDDACN
ncbi:hypothetical protein DPMN_124605 [Dreissena polymorpha]|uniref:Prostamide/prostaglandin F synthase n=2 Tax=Dreissena polymorpha TaxID=45954 RepID=A0A9D4JTZ2_DREPO|nr:hypothetical protein DPMN_124605 [Dreissena polymorpha]